MEESQVSANCLVQESGLEVRIGNFVEVEKSKIAVQPKPNYLAYIGDTEIGECVMLVGHHLQLRRRQ